MSTNSLIIPPWGMPLSILGQATLGVWNARAGASTTVPCVGRWPVDATLNGAGATRSTGQFGPCITLDGSTGYIESVVPFPSQDKDNWNPPVGTVIVWFRSSVTPGANNAWLTGRASNLGSNTGIWILLLNDTSIYFNVANTGQGSSSAAINSTTGYTDGNWHMIAAVFTQGNGTTQKLYVDGRLIGTATSSPSWSLGPFNIRWGIATDTFWNKYQGDLDPGAWFGHELTASEIVALWRTGPAGFYRGPMPIPLTFTSAQSAFFYDPVGIGGGLVGKQASLVG